MLQALQQLLPQPQRGLLFAVLVWLGADMVVGVVASLKTGTFDARVLPNQLKQVLFFVGGLLAMQLTTTSLFGAASAGTTDSFILAATACITKSSADVVQKIGILISGVNNTTPPQTITGHDSNTPSPVVIPTNITR